MPLTFESVSHGTVAFGFFNVESDMLLLERYFFFADDFCRVVGAFAESRAPAPPTEWEVYSIRGMDEVGDLMGAIHGIRFTGFIGDTYRRFPFPDDPAGFRQKPGGYRNRAAFVSMVEKYARRVRIPLSSAPNGEEAVIGAYRFHRRWFQALIRYVWQGGYPRWENDEKPSYVVEMRRRVEESAHPLFRGTIFDEADFPHPFSN